LNTITSPSFISSIFVGVQATTSPSIKEGLIESEVTKSIGNGVPAHTDKKRDAISKSAAKNIKLPINGLNLNFMLHPIPITKSVYIFGYIIFALKN
jgi:hypothetical protein